MPDAGDDDLDSRVPEPDDGTDTGATTTEADPLKTPGDPPEARQPEEGDQPQQSGSDDPDATSDPLVLAQMESDAPATAPASTTKPATKTPEAPKPEASAPTKGQAKTTAGDTPKQDEADLPEVADALDDLPAEDWSKLSHKAKSRFLNQRKAIRGIQSKLSEVQQRAKQFEERYSAVESFVKSAGLKNEEYVAGVEMAAAIKRADAATIPILERTLAQIRKVHGQEPKAPPASMPPEPVLDDDLKALLEEAEGYGVDTAKVRARFKAKPPPAPPKQEAPPPPPPAADEGGQDRQQVDDRASMEQILDSLEALGVEDAVEHVRGLVQSDPSLAKVMSLPPAQRLKAVLAAHHAVAAKRAKPATTQPITGRRPQAPARSSTSQPSDDPLAIAIRGRR